MRHGPVRRWWTPWRRRCRCGCRWYPCPDAAARLNPPPAVVDSLRLNQRPPWDGPTLALPAERLWLTPGQAHRVRNLGRWPS